LSKSRSELIPCFLSSKSTIFLSYMKPGESLPFVSLTPTGQFHLNNRLNELSMEAKSGKKYKWREFWELKEAFHDIKHAYAITSHMSQGSSYLITFIDLEDIMLNRNRSEAFRSLYVAATRQREAVYFA
jgi:hypothetical protein